MKAGGGTGEVTVKGTWDPLYYFFVSFCDSVIISKYRVKFEGRGRRR
jgi:hypothetical protein